MAESRTGMAALTAANISYVWTQKESTTTKANMTRALDNVSVTEGYIAHYSIAAGGNLTIPLGTIASAKIAAVGIAAGSTSTSATIEINNSGVTDAFLFWAVSGGAGITQIEIVETGAADIVKIVVLVAE